MTPESGEEDKEENKSRGWRNSEEEEEEEERRKKRRRRGGRRGKEEEEERRRDRGKGIKVGRKKMRKGSNGTTEGQDFSDIGDVGEEYCYTSKTQAQKH